VRLRPTLLLPLLLTACPTAEESPAPPEPVLEIDEISLVGFVDPMIGTDGSGNAIPGALVPHGMVRASPDTVGDAGDVDAYEYDSTLMEGFSHTHLEGPGGGANGYSQVLLLPQTGPLVVQRSARTSAFDHATEEARPGYYAVTLDDYDVRAEMTATGHAAVHRYTFPPGEGRLLLDLGHNLGASMGGQLTLDGPVWTGFGTYNVHPVAALLSDTDGTIAFVTVFFHVELSEVPIATGTFEGPGNNPTPAPGTSQAYGPELGGWGDFDFDQTTTLEVRVGLSLLSEEMARANLEAEVGDGSFEEVAVAAGAAWNSALNRVQAESDEPAVLRTFYTGLYHSMFQPADYTEAGGWYAIGASGQHVRRRAVSWRYFTDDWCMWDTFRTSHPLATLVEPELRDDVIRSMLTWHEEGGWLPKCTWNATGYSRVMIGNHAVPIIADSFVKGLDDYDHELAWEAVDRVGTAEIPNLPDVGCGYVNQGTPPDYLELGYVPTECDSHQSVSMTLEHAYDDWSAARMAEAMGRTADAARYDERGGYWVNHWNDEIGFMQARDRAGDWVEPFDPNDDSDANDFCEADSWIYSWFVPHDVPALVERMGGQQAFVERLDTFFDDGHFEASNQPSFHVPWLYAAAGVPEGTSARVREILDTEYGDQPDGLPGNDDAGSTSAWMVLAMLGMYPIAPGDGLWTLTAPRLQSATLHLHPAHYDGGTVRIEVIGDPATQHVVESITWNGEELSEPVIAHSALVQGGTLLFTLADGDGDDDDSAPPLDDDDSAPLDDDDSATVDDDDSAGPEEPFRVAAVQLVSANATDRPVKLAAMQAALAGPAAEAVAAGADMLVLPETAFVTYDCGPRPALAEAVPSTDPEDVYPHLADFAAQHGVWLYYGDYVVSADPARPHNSGIMLGPDGALAFVYNKHYGSSSEQGCGTFGGSPYTFDVGHPLGTIGCLICKDFHAGGTADIDGLTLDYMLGIAGDSGRFANGYEGHMRQIITTEPAAANGGIWVNMGNEDGESFFMDPAGVITGEAGAGDQILYTDYPQVPE